MVKGSINLWTAIILKALRLSMRMLVLSLIAYGFLASEISVAKTLVNIPGGVNSGYAEPWNSA